MVKAKRVLHIARSRRLKDQPPHELSLHDATCSVGAMCGDARHEKRPSADPPALEHERVCRVLVTHPISTLPHPRKLVFTARGLAGRRVGRSAVWTAAAAPSGGDHFAPRRMGGTSPGWTVTSGKRANWPTNLNSRQARFHRRLVMGRSTRWFAPDWRHGLHAPPQAEGRDDDLSPRPRPVPICRSLTDFIHHTGEGCGGRPPKGRQSFFFYMGGARPGFGARMDRPGRARRGASTRLCFSTCCRRVGAELLEFLLIYMIKKRSGRAALTPTRRFFPSDVPPYFFSFLSEDGIRLDSYAPVWLARVEHCVNHWYDRVRSNRRAKNSNKSMLQSPASVSSFWT